MKFKFKKRYLWIAAYCGFARHLPESTLCPWAKKIRALCGRHIAKRFGSNVNIEPRAHFTSQLEIGDNSGIGRDSYLIGPVIIGKNVMMGPECMFIAVNHRFDRLDIPMCEQGFQPIKPIVIGDDVWIGARVMLLSGVHIGNGCVLGAGTVIAKDIPDYAIVVGNPARILRYRNADENVDEELQRTVLEEEAVQREE